MARVDRTRPSNPDAGLSILAADVVIRGDLKASGELHLDGRIVGDVEAHDIVIGATGSVHGDVQADALTLFGSVTGNVSARTIRLGPAARLAGDVRYASLGIETGAPVEGRFVHVVDGVEIVPPQLVAVGGD